MGAGNFGSFGKMFRSLMDGRGIANHAGVAKTPVLNQLQVHLSVHARTNVKNKSSSILNNALFFLKTIPIATLLLSGYVLINRQKFIM